MYCRGWLVDLSTPSTTKGGNAGGKKKITAEIMAPKIVASQPPNGDRLQRRPLVPMSFHSPGFFPVWELILTINTVQNFLGHALNTIVQLIWWIFSFLENYIIATHRSWRLESQQYTSQKCLARKYFRLKAKTSGIGSIEKLYIHPTSLKVHAQLTNINGSLCILYVHKYPVWAGIKQEKIPCTW